MVQFSSGRRGASFDKNRVPISVIVSAQQAVPGLTDTACHGLRAPRRGATGCFAVIGNRFHI
jgi:hypothetical protein